MSEKLNIAMIFGNVRRPRIIGGPPPIQVTGKVLTFSLWNLVGDFYEYSLYDSKITSGSIVEVVPSRYDIAHVQAAKIMPEADVTAGYVKLYCKNAPAADIDITINIHTGLSTTPAKGFFIASGADGIDGLSAYQIAVLNGFEGTEQEWLESLKGEDGEDGNTPIKGVDYFDGENGITPHIGPNGNWWIGATDTGVKAAGENGRGIASIALHSTVGLVKTYRITYTDATTFDFDVTDGEDGGGGTGGAETFLELTDTPNTYTGQKGKFTAVTDAEDGLEFVSLCEKIALCKVITDLQDDIEDLQDQVDEIILGQSAFVATWNLPSGAFTLPAQNIGSYNCEIDWGDGSPRVQVSAYNDPNLTHTFSTAGEYDISVIGVYGNFSISNSALWRDKIVEIKQWGTGIFQTFYSAFRGCQNINSIPDGPITCTILNTNNVFERTFENCKLIPYIPPKLFSKQTNLNASAFSYTFSGCTGLTGSIPAGLFMFSTQVTTNAFYSTFKDCSGLTGSIPADLFRYNTQITASAFNSTFSGCTGLTGSIPADLFRYNTQVTTGAFVNTFFGCTGLTGSIPADLFRYNTQVTASTFNGTFLGCTGLTGSIPADLFRYNTQVTTSAFTNTFRSCTGLTGSIPADLFRYNTQVTTYAFQYTFQGCIGLTGSIPADLFRYNTQVTASAFASTFQGCSGLTGLIPAALFRYNTQVTTYAFQYTFQGCIGLTGSIPADLFRYNTQVTTYAFNGTFSGCAGLTGSIPADLFRDNTQVTTSAFNGTFWGCTGLTGSIPADLFRYNTQVTTSAFTNTFRDCTGLTGSIPADLFRYNTQVTTSAFNATFVNCSGLTAAPAGLFAFNLLVSTNGFASTFENCTALQADKFIFCNPGNENTRFKNISTSFVNCFKRASYNGITGEAPELWNYDFGTATIGKTGCFGGAGNSLDSLSNYNNIPNDWK